MQIVPSTSLMQTNEPPDKKTVRIGPELFVELSTEHSVGSAGKLYSLTIPSVYPAASEEPRTLIELTQANSTLLGISFNSAPTPGTKDGWHPADSNAAGDDDVAHFNLPFEIGSISISSFKGVAGASFDPFSIEKNDNLIDESFGSIGPKHLIKSPFSDQFELPTTNMKITSITIF